MNFVSPGDLRFRYRLEGYDSDFVAADDRRVAHYTNLAPGRYRFVVAASNDDGSWSESPAALEIELLPALVPDGPRSWARGSC